VETGQRSLEDDFDPEPQLSAAPMAGE
jgi:hypothetical protein